MDLTDSSFGIGKTSPPPLPPEIVPPPRPKKGEVKLNSMPWFHGKISRDKAEDLLLPREDGLFLVRESTNFPGDYTLCVCFQGRVEHYRVIYKDNQLTIDEEEYFENLAHLVEVTYFHLKTTIFITLNRIFSSIIAKIFKERMNCPRERESIVKAMRNESESS